MEDKKITVEEIDAHGKFRQQAYAKVISLLQAKQEAFSPSAQQGGQAGDASDGQRLDDA